MSDQSSFWSRPTMNSTHSATRQALDALVWDLFERLTDVDAELAPIGSGADEAEPVWPEIPLDRLVTRG